MEVIVGIDYSIKIPSCVIKGKKHSYFKLDIMRISYHHIDYT